MKRPTKEELILLTAFINMVTALIMLIKAIIAERAKALHPSGWLISIYHIRKKYAKIDTMD